MAFVLLVQMEDRQLRFVLDVGRHLVGTADECAVRFRHPTLSRRHAAIEVNADGAWVEDLGSTNGTRLDGASVTGATRVEPQSSITLGSVEARLLLVAAGDVEVGVALPTLGSVPGGDDSSRAPQPATVGPGALQSFALKHLPPVVEQLASGESVTEVAQAVGSALLQSLPCRRVSVTTGEAEGTLFSGERSGTGAAVTVTAGERFRVRVDFLGEGFAQTYEPLVRIAAAMVHAAGRAEGRAAIVSSAPPSAEVPRPVSVMAEVREIYARAAQVARGRVSVLICGESGTGKELLARYIHSASERSAAPLVTLNCAALPRDLLESELFGVERGVATGVEARPGKLEAAHGGTLFLDEIGDMAPETQAKILRALQEREVYRVGGHRARPADLRVISATNRDLDAMLSESTFRRDLYHRIADWVVELPPLRRRRQDIPNLAAHFLARACAERGVRAAGISRSALEALVAYVWPGNVRQLEKEMERAALFLADGELLDTSRLQPAILTAAPDSAPDSLKEALERAEREHIARILHECGGVVVAAAERLGLGVSTLYRRLRVLGVEARD